MTPFQVLTKHHLGRYGALLLSAFVSFACESEEENKPLTADEAPSAEPSGPVVSPEIAEAVAQVAEAQPTASGGENAPPPNGILGAERAQKEAPEGAAPKLVMGKTGSEPRVQLGGPEPTEERIGQLTVSVRMGPSSGMPSVAFKLELSGKKNEAGNDEVTVDVVDASLASEQPGRIPDDIAKAIPGMKGSSLGYESKDAAVLGNMQIELDPKTDQRMGALMTAAADTLSTVLLTTPKEPVGKDGFWMITQREHLALGTVVGYHLVKVENVEAGRATLSVNSKRYLATEEFQGLPAVQFMGSATTDLVMVPGERLPVEGRTQQTMQAMLQRENGAPRPVMFDLRALFAFPPKPHPEAPATAPSPAPTP